jgi:hypothetical protein
VIIAINWKMTGAICRAPKVPSTLKRAPLLAFFIAILMGCNQQPAPSPSPTTPAGHHHHAPHNGTLIVLGNEFGHMELVLEPTTGLLNAYFLDGEAQNAVRPQNHQLQIKIDGKGELLLKPVADELTGETHESSSHFSVESDSLKGVSEFQGVLQQVEVKGRVFTEVKLSFPEGNETHEGHHH